MFMFMFMFRSIRRDRQHEGAVPPRPPPPRPHQAQQGVLQVPAKGEPGLADSASKVQKNNDDEHAQPIECVLLINLFNGKY